MGIVSRWLLPRATEEVHEVTPHDPFDVVLRITACPQQPRKRLQVGDRIHVHRRLLGAEATVEIGADADMLRVACQLADMVDVIADPLDFQLEVGRLAAQMRPAGNHHDGIEGHAQDAAPLNHRLDLIVRELTVPRSQRAAVLMTGPQRPVVNIERIPEAFVAQMRHIQDDSQPHSPLEILWSQTAVLPNRARLKALLNGAEYIITDSGGTSREAYFLQKKSLIMMDHPFWPEIIDVKCSLQTVAESDAIIQNFNLLPNLKPDFTTNIFGIGNAAENIRKHLTVYLAQ